MRWSAILGQAGNGATILAMSLVSLLMNAGALELTIRDEIELNRELTSAGLGNLVAGLGGGMPGYQDVALSALGYRMRTRSRLVGIVPAILRGGVLLFGASLVSYVLKPLLGSLLLFAGLAFLAEWTLDAWTKLSRAEDGALWGWARGRKGH